MSAAAGLAPIPSTVVEGAYSTAVYPRVQAALTRASNLVPFALFDVLLCGVAAWWTIAAIRDVRRHGFAAATMRVGLRTVSVASLSYIAFLLLWGLNYRRVLLADRLALTSAPVTSAAVVALANQTVERVNALYATAHALAPPRARAVDPDLAAAFARTLQELGYRSPVVPGVPKTTVIDLYFRRAGVAGMTDPYFLESLTVSNLLPFERPAVIAHEWSHLAGITDEGEANFVGWLACLHGGPAHQYSAWLFLYGEIAAALDNLDARAVAAHLAAGPRADLRAVRERLLRDVSRPLSSAGWRVYDSYLKANRIEAGAASYSGVVRLAAAASLTGDWLPALRNAPR